MVFCSYLLTSLMTNGNEWILTLMVIMPTTYERYIAVLLIKHTLFRYSTKYTHTRFMEAHSHASQHFEGDQKYKSNH